MTRGIESVRAQPAWRDPYSSYLAVLTQPHGAGEQAGKPALPFHPTAHIAS